MIEIDEIKAADLQEVNELLVNYKNSHNDLLFRENYQEVFIDYLNELLEDDDRKALVAKENSQIIGLIIGMISDNSRLELPEKIGYVGFLSVHKTHQRKGIGKELYHNMINWFKSRNINDVELYTSINNSESRLFWASLGFETYLEKRKTKI